MNLRPAYLLSQYLYYSQFSIHKAMMHYKLGQISPEIKGRWLDIGAGYQPYKNYFAGAEEYLTTNTKSIYSTPEIEELEKLTNYWIEDGKNLPITGNSMDGVACFQVLAVIDKPEEFFNEINRVMKPGGKLLLTTDFLYPAWNNVDRYHHTAFSLKQLSELTGFRVEVVESFGGLGSTVYKLFMRYMRSFPGIWKSQKSLAKIISPFFYLILLILLPIISLAGRLIFFIEKNNRINTDFTFNLLLKATKKPA